MRQRRLKNEINVVPYIDVMLVLLVIFMVATPMMSTGEVKLPSSGTAPQKPDKFLRVEVAKDGGLSLFDVENKEQKLDGLPSLSGALAGQRQRNPDIAVLVSADEEVPYRSVMQALEEVRKQGFSSVGLETSVK
ncbi:ExbD/TolR family protein [Azonexus hydrophilus]|jgi:biopolymer transport protein TolR|uniref:ExbD/TolR family protein n=1 Tax=Azonexus hydrophilus TaxID=418702 RepID=A0ABZ2XII5_9RHOO|nr:ExbD/TolR family protein [Azonexus hydrophilus]MBS4018457.1 ExbD/TolR family protein [Dechloromonas sp.]